MNLSFLSRLLAAFVLVLILAVVGPYFYFKTILNQAIMKEAQEETEVILRHVIQQYQKSGVISAPELGEWIQGMGRSLGLRLTFIAVDGAVLAESSLPLADVGGMENHATRPEILAAQKDGAGSSIRFSDTLRIDLIYSAVRVPALNDVPEGYLRLAKPVSRMSVMIDSLGKSYASIVFGLLVVAAVISVLLARQISRNISSMSEAAEAIGKGEYGRRISAFPAKEILPLAKSINHMASSIENHIQTITDQKEELEAILDGMREGVMVLDAQGRVKSVNKAMEKIFDLPPRLQGRQPIEAVRSPELQQRCEHIFSPPSDETPQPEKILVETHNDRFHDVNIIPLGQRHSKLGAIIVFHEITELKRLERVRRDFVANVSHELRTPLTSIKGYAETLLDSPTPDGAMVKSFMEVVVKNANAMSNLLDDLLQLAKLESSDSSGSFQVVNVDNAVTSAWKFCASLAQKRNIRLEKTKGDAAVEVLADYDQLVQVLRNLIENAVKYSPVGGVIEVSVDPHGDQEWLVSVKDNGPGVARKDQERIFERFYRVDKHRNTVPGTGLGLAICRHIVRNHGGRIWVESPSNSAGTGSVFKFTMKRGA